MKRRFDVLESVIITFALVMSAIPWTVSSSAFADAHVHVFQYDSNGTSSITATCVSSDECSEYNSTKPMIVTINAPDNLFYDGSAKEATITGYTAAENLEALPAISYSDYQGAMGGAPVEPGTYTASITWGSVPAYVTYDISRAPLYLITPPTASSITFGDTLATSNIAGGVVESLDGTTITGTYAWDDDTIAPTVADSNSTTYAATFTPDDTDHYQDLSLTVTVPVNKADADHGGVLPDNLTAVYGSTLNSVSLPTGWTWVDDTTSVGSVGTHSFPANFNPDPDNYNDETNVDVDVTVTPADAVVTLEPAAKTGLVYSKAAYPLVDEGTATGGSLEYCLGTSDAAGSEWGISVPEGIDAGTYYVWYKVPASASYNGTAPAGPVAVTIAPKPVNVSSGITASDKTYDGSTIANVNTAGAVISPVETGDELTVSATGVFEDAEAGTGKEVIITLTGLLGTCASNYVLENTAYGPSVTADIVPKAITYTANPQSVELGGTVSSLPTDVTLTTGDLVSGHVLSAITLDGDTTSTTTTGTVTITGAVIEDGNSVDKTSNYTISYVEGTLTVTPIAAVITNPPTRKTGLSYNGTAQALINPGTVTGGEFQYTLGDNTSAGTNWGTAAPTGTEAGLYYVWTKVEGDENHSGHAVAGPMTVEILPRTVTVASGITASNKTYDDTTTATVITAGASITGLVGSDNLGVSATGAFADPDAGTGKTVNLTITGLTGSDAANYVLATSGNQDTTTANIDKKAVTYKANDQNLSLGDSVSSLTTDVTPTAGGLIEGHTLTAVTIDGDTSHATNAGTLTITGMTISDSGSNDNTSNYDVTYEPGTLTVASVPAEITALPTIVTGLTYNGSDRDLIVGGTATGGTMEYSLGTNTVAGTSWSSTLPTGNDAGNYYVWYRVTGDSDHSSLAATGPLTVQIGKKTVAVTGGITASNKTYDGTTDATLDVTGVTFDDLVGGDSLGVTATGAFTDANVGTGKTVDITYTGITGTASGNYILASSGNQDDTTANISQRAITIKAADQTVGVNGSISTAANRANVTVGSLAAEHSIASIVLTADTSVVTDNGVITAASATIEDGNNTDRTANYSISYEPGVLTVMEGAAELTTDPAAVTGLEYTGTDQTLVNDGVAVNGTVLYSLGTDSDPDDHWNSIAPKGKDAGTYYVWYKVTGNPGYASLPAAGSVTVTIGKKPVTVTDGITASAKDYDGTNTATVDTTAATLSGVIPGETVTVTATGEFASVDAGDNVTVNLTMGDLGGADAGNYELAGSGHQATTTANINPRPVTYRAKPQTVALDGALSSTTSDVELTSGTLVEGHSLAGVTITGDASSVTETGIVQISAVVINDAGSNDVTANYDPTFVNGTLTVTPAAAVVVSGPAAVTGLEYTGLPLALATPGSCTGGTMVYSLGTNTTPGTSWSSTIPTGTDAKYYYVYWKVEGDSDHSDSLPDGPLNVEIAKKTLKVTGGITASDKTYDGTTDATISTTGAAFDALVAGDVLTVTATGAFADADAGTTKTVNIEVTGLEGEDAGNYVLATSGNQNSTTAAISKRALTYKAKDQTVALDDPVSSTTSDVQLTSGTLVAGHSLTSVTITGDTSATTTSGTLTITGVVIKDTGSTDRTANYDTTFETGTLTVTAAPATVTAPPSAFTDLVYDGTEQALVSAGTATGGTMEYAIGSNATTAPTSGWDSAIPAKQSAQTYHVWFRAKGDSTHGDSAAQCVNVRIGKKDVTVDGITAEDKAYDGKDTATLNYDGVTFDGLVAGDDLSVTATGKFADSNVGENKSVAITAITLSGSSDYKLSDSGNQTSAEASISQKPVTIKAVNQTVTVKGKISQATSKVKATGLVTGHIVSTVKLSGDTSKVTSSGVIRIESVKITANRVDVTSNYNITTGDGILVVKAAETKKENKHSHHDDDDEESSGGSSGSGGGSSSGSSTYNGGASSSGAATTNNSNNNVNFQALATNIANAVAAGTAGAGAADGTGAGGAGAGKVVYWNQGYALPYVVMKALQDHPDVTLVFKTNYGGVNYTFTLPGSQVKAYPTIPWYGPLYLYATYPQFTVIAPGLPGDTTMSADAYVTAMLAGGAATGRTYIVQKGDTLHKIAKKLATTVKDLKDKNNLKNINIIHPGQVLYY